MMLSALNQRRWRNFRRNRRAFWSLVIFAVLFVLSLLAEVTAPNAGRSSMQQAPAWLATARAVLDESLGSEHVEVGR